MTDYITEFTFLNVWSVKSPISEELQVNGFCDLVIIRSRYFLVVVL